MPVRLALWRAALIFVGLNLAWEITQDGPGSSDCLRRTALHGG